MGTYTREKLEDELERDEGLRLKTYRCTAGKLTIGIGRNLDARRGDGCLGLTFGEQHDLGITRDDCIARGITRAQASALFAGDIAGCEADLDRKLPWWRGLSDARQRVMLNMCFNMGIGTLLTFQNTLAMVKAGRFVDAARGMLASKWAKQVGERANRLAAMMRAG